MTLKKISKKVAEEVCNGVDTEGFDYYFVDYTGETYKGTELETPVAAYREAATALKSVLDTLREKYEIEEC